MDTAKVSILSIGEELLLGQIIDSNSSYIASKLWEAGLYLSEIRVVGDHLQKITETVSELSENNDILIITGGLGPTVDDLTRDALAKASGVGLAMSDKLLEEISVIFKRINRPMVDNNKRQALIPVGAKGISNKFGTAPGIDIIINRCRCFAMPGVPKEMKKMFDNYVVPELSFANRKFTLIKELKLFGIGESVAGEKIGDLMKRGRNPAVGTRVKESVISVRVAGSAENAVEVERLVNQDVTVLKETLGEYVFGEDNDSLASVVVDTLEKKCQYLALAESCTGGLISKLITDIPGSSKVFKEGFITYSNDSKVKYLGVSENTINSYGAVSEEVAEQMADKVRKVSSADYGLGVTGIAGPGGGTEEKPVGLIYIAVSSEKKTLCRECRLSYDRETNRIRTANIALAMLLEVIEL